MPRISARKGFAACGYNLRGPACQWAVEGKTHEELTRVLSTHVQATHPSPNARRERRKPAPLEAEEVTAREIIIDGLRGGANECVVFPSTKHFPRLAIFGRIQQPITFTMATQGTALDDDDAEDGALEHFADVTWLVREGQGFKDS